MATMYVTEQGARIEKEYRRILVTKDDKVLMRVPLARISHVVLVGWVGTTTPALHALLRAGVGLSLISRTGRLHGRLTPPTGKNIPRRHAQYARAQDADFCLDVGRAIVAGKLRNQRTMVRRICRDRPELDDGPIEDITAAIKAIDNAADLAEVRGQEGYGARAYFEILRQAIPEGWGFERRARRPPPDPANALLSLGYTLLTQNMIAAAEVVGLDPYDGLFHADKHGRPALALDLEEEFRSIIVDSVVLTLINKELLTLDDFCPGPKGGVRLEREALKTFFRQYGKRIHTRVIHPELGHRLTYQQCFEVQARLLAKVIEEKKETYVPFLTR
jgi:CRISPR-associated protein Cas1